MAEANVAYSPRQPHLSRAPILEALIDIAVEPPEGMDPSEIESIFPSEAFGYYLKGPIVESSVSFGVAPEGQVMAPSNATRLVGRRFHSKDEKYVLQLRPDRFVLSRLAPYETWSTLVQETRRLWSAFVQGVGPHGVTRIAVRYINSMSLPLGPGLPFQKYLRTLGGVPEGIPQDLEGFFQRFQLFDAAREARVILSVAVDSHQTNVPSTILLDIDVFCQQNFDIADSRIWSKLEDLRNLKNSVFFRTLTDQALERFQ